MEKGVSVISRTISITTCFERKVEPKKKAIAKDFFLPPSPRLSWIRSYYGHSKGY